MNPPFFLQWTSAVCYTIMNDANGMYPSWLDWCFVTTQLVSAFVKLSSTCAAYFLNLYISSSIHHIYITERYILQKRHYIASFMWKIVTDYVTDIVKENLYILLEIHQQHTSNIWRLITDAESSSVVCFWYVPSREFMTASGQFIIKYVFPAGSW